MFNRLKKFWILFFLFPAGAWCLDVTPAYQIFQLKKGESVSGQVSVTNTEPEEVRITPVTKNWFLSPANKKIKVEDWLIMREKPFVLTPGESKVVAFTAKAPKNADGELVGMVSQRMHSKSQGSIEFVMSVAVYVAVIGTEKLNVRLAAFSVTQSSNSAEAAVLLQNTGNVHARPRGTFQVFNDKSELFAVFEIGKGEPIFPGNTGTIAKQLEDFHFTPGRYTAKIKLADIDRGTELVNAKKTFVVNQDGKAELK